MPLIFARLIKKNNLLFQTIFQESASISESLKAAKDNFPTIFKENLALQLEAVYRQNVNNVATEIQRRIDYLKEVEETKLKFERDILLTTITSEVFF